MSQPDRVGEAQFDLHAPQAAKDGVTPAASQNAQGCIDILTIDGELRPLAEIEADIIRHAIGHYRGRMSEVARRLGIGRSTLYRKLAELEIDTSS